MCYQVASLEQATVEGEIRNEKKLCQILPSTALILWGLSPAQDRVAQWDAIESAYDGLVCGLRQTGCLVGEGEDNQGRYAVARVRTGLVLYRSIPQPEGGVCGKGWGVWSRAGSRCVLRARVAGEGSR